MQFLMAVLILLALPLVGVTLSWIACRMAIWILDPNRTKPFAWMARWRRPRFETPAGPRPEIGRV
jgi:hypothetical protein